MPSTTDSPIHFLDSADGLALDGTTGAVVGFVTALTDGVLSASIPLLEVLPAYQGRGIGTKLMTRILARLGDRYMVDVLWDPDVQPFYARLGKTLTTGSTSAATSATRAHCHCHLEATVTTTRSSQ